MQRETPTATQTPWQKNSISGVAVSAAGRSAVGVPPPANAITGASQPKANLAPQPWPPVFRPQQVTRTMQPAIAARPNGAPRFVGHVAIRPAGDALQADFTPGGRVRVASQPAPAHTTSVAAGQSAQQKPATGTRASNPPPAAGLPHDKGLLPPPRTGSRASSSRSSGTPSTAVQPKLHPGVEAFQVNMQPKAGGWPLPREVQARMEAAFGADFSDVRVHVGPEVGAIGAIAFTWGSNIHFAPGYYSPHTPHGQQLLAHELSHVVQQRAGRVRNPYGMGVAVVQDAALEAEADRLGRQAVTQSGTAVKG
jgi:hypothetical protein